MTPRLISWRAAGALAAVAGLGLIAFVLVWFQPQKLVIDDTVSERLPTAAPAAAEPAAAESAAAEGEAPAMAMEAPAVRTLSSASFLSHEHETEGRARVIELRDGRRYVRFEDFRTSNGPLLRVYLSAAAPDGRNRPFDDRFVDLGALKGNVGDQNYAIPRGTDLGAYRSVVVWCKRFSVPFGAARV